MAVSRIESSSIERRMLMANCTIAAATPAAFAAAVPSHSVIESADRSRCTKGSIADHTDLNCRIGRQFMPHKRCMEKFSSLAARYFCRSHHCHKWAESVFHMSTTVHRSHFCKIELVDHILTSEGAVCCAAASVVRTLCCKNLSDCVWSVCFGSYCSDSGRGLSAGQCAFGTHFQRARNAERYPGVSWAMAGKL